VDCPDKTTQFGKHIIYIYIRVRRNITCVTRILIRFYISPTKFVFVDSSYYVILFSDIHTISDFGWCLVVEFFFFLIIFTVLFIKYCSVDVEYFLLKTTRIQVSQGWAFNGFELKKSN